jgi:hypothetical protein
MAPNYTTAQKLGYSIYNTHFTHGGYKYSYMLSLILDENLCLGRRVALRYSLEHTLPVTEMFFYCLQRLFILYPTCIYSTIQKLC